MSGTFYWVIYPASGTDPANTTAGADYIIAGQDGAGVTATASGSESGTGQPTTITEQTPPTTLTAGVAYRVAWTWKEGSTYASGANKVAIASFTTLDPKTVSVPAGSLTLIGLAPAVTAVGTATVAVPAGSLTLTGFAPTVTAGGGQTVAVPAGALTLTGFAPTVTAVGTASVSAPAGALTLTGFAPDVQVVAGTIVQVPAGTLTLTGYAPTVATTANITVPAGALTLTGYAPTVTAVADQVVQVPAGALTLTGYAPTVTVTQAVLVEAPAGALTLTGREPTILVGGVAVATTQRRSGPRGIGYRKRYSVKIDDEEFIVDSPAEVEELLTKAREEAEKQAQVALQRAAKAQKRPVRKVLADARKALQVPDVRVEGEPDYAQQFMRDIAALYQSTLDTIEIGALMRDTQRRLEDDDEDVLLLL